MHPVAVADAGGLLVHAGLLEGVEHEVNEILALDATSLLLAEYLVLRYETVPHRARAEFGLVMRVVQEWFPVRPLAVDAALAASAGDGIPEETASLALAESLTVPLLTKNRELASAVVSVLHC